MDPDPYQTKFKTDFRTKRQKTLSKLFAQNISLRTNGIILHAIQKQSQTGSNKYFAEHQSL